MRQQMDGLCDSIMKLKGKKKDKCAAFLLLPVPEAWGMSRTDLGSFVVGHAWCMGTESHMGPWKSGLEKKCCLSPTRRNRFGIRRGPSWLQKGSARASMGLEKELMVQESTWAHLSVSIYSAPGAPSKRQVTKIQHIESGPGNFRLVWRQQFMHRIGELISTTQNCC